MKQTKMMAALLGLALAWSAGAQQYRWV